VKAALDSLAPVPSPDRKRGKRGIGILRRPLRPQTIRAQTGSTQELGCELQKKNRGGEPPLCCLVSPAPKAPPLSDATLVCIPDIKKKEKKGEQTAARWCCSTLPLSRLVTIYGRTVRLHADPTKRRKGETKRKPPSRLIWFWVVDSFEAGKAAFSFSSHPHMFKLRKKRRKRGKGRSWRATSSNVTRWQIRPGAEKGPA